MLTAGVVLTGGTAELSGLSSLAERVFQTPVRVGSVECSGGAGEMVRGPAFATSVGLLQLAGMSNSESAPLPVSAGVLAKVKHRMGYWFREFF